MRVLWVVLTRLGARFGAAKQPPLPLWQQEALRERGNPRVSVHRGAFPEDMGLKRAGAAIALPAASVPVVVGMTTTPTRIAQIRPAIESLLNQTQAATIVINVPARYNVRRKHWEGKSVKIPEWLRELAAERPVVVHEVTNDWGPATKLVGTAIAVARGVVPATPRTVVVAADDDHEWEPYALATLVRHGFGRRNASFDAVWSYYTYPYPRGVKETPYRICVAQAGDMLATGVASLRRLEEWGAELLTPNGRLPSCFFVDDLFFAAYFRHTARADVYAHPWRYWLFKEAQRRTKVDGEKIKPCKGACSPVSFRLRYPDSLAMGPPRATHSRNCMAQLQALGWWPTTPTTADVCLRDVSPPRDDDLRE